MYIFEKDHRSKIVTEDNDSKDSLSLFNNFQYFLKSLDGITEYNHLSTRQLSDTPFSLTFFNNDKLYIKHILPAKQIIETLFLIKEKTHVLRYIEDKILYANIILDRKFFRTEGILSFKDNNSFFYSSKNFESIDNLIYYECKFTSSEFSPSIKGFSDSHLTFRFYFNKKHIDNNIPENVFIINNNDFNKYLHPFLAKKLGFDIPYSEENFKNLLEIENLINY